MVESDADEALKAIVCAKMADLVPDFLRLIQKHIEEVIASWQQVTRGVMTTILEQGSYFWRSIKELVKLVSDIFFVPDSTLVALEAFLVVFRHAMPELWDAYDSRDMIMILFDEPLLAMCINLREDSGINMLQEWRAKLTGQDLEISGQDWRCEPFLLRSMQFISECCAREAAQVLIGKVTEGRLPVELADLILEQVLAANFPFTPNVPTREDNSTWEIKIVGKPRISESLSSPYPCCPHFRHVRPEESTFWSTAERKYIRFHLTSPVAMKSGSADRFEFTSRGCLPTLGSSFWARCSEETQTAERTQYTLVADGALPSEAGSRYFWEVDHGVNRNWRIKENEWA